MSQKILVCIAPGTEELEAITTADILIRADYDVTIASAASDGALAMKGANGITLTADIKLVDVADDEFDCIVLPGGTEGACCFRDSTLLIEMIKQQKNDHRFVAAICASPAIVLQEHDIYPEARMTCYPAQELIDMIPAGNHRVKRVFTDVLNKLITSQGPGSSLEFAMEIINQLSGKQKAAEVAAPMIVLPNLHYQPV
ncbi:MAG: DJ-1/PfpI family protein [Aliivibrio sp.]|uniref:DJ-1 family glyoxalase III n=1 Tax=Aliivibrio sp. TaxID=1872443 RepID=UPI001A377242|nr:DJ-1/PfpI family protein [Aliivibrio sp.]